MSESATATTDDEMPRWRWTFAGEEYREGCSEEWRAVYDSGTVVAEHPAIAAVLLLTGLPYDGHEPPGESDWLPDYDGERGFSLTIEPSE